MYVYLLVCYLINPKQTQKYVVWVDSNFLTSKLLVYKETTGLEKVEETQDLHGGCQFPLAIFTCVLKLITTALKIKNTSL